MAALRALWTVLFAFRVVAATGVAYGGVHQESATQPRNEPAMDVVALNSTGSRQEWTAQRQAVFLALLLPHGRIQ